MARRHNGLWAQPHDRLRNRWFPETAAHAEMVVHQQEKIRVYGVSVPDNTLGRVPFEQSFAAASARLRHPAREDAVRSHIQYRQIRRQGGSGFDGIASLAVGVVFQS